MFSKVMVAKYEVRLRTESASFPVAIRWGERVSAALILAAMLPGLLLLFLFVYLLSGRSPLVGDRRVGKDGRLFWMWKMRTMWPGARLRARKFDWIEYVEPASRRLMKAPSDPRVTSAFAAFCRKHSIDELPQLWHVVQGKMSYVGPRPITLEELREHYGNDAPEVLTCLPGLSGLWQVTGRNRLTYSQRRRLDLFLVRNNSPILYLAILRRTVVCILKGKSAW